MIVKQPHHYTKDKLSTGPRRECKDGVIDDNTISIYVNGMYERKISTHY